MVPLMTGLSPMYVLCMTYVSPIDDGCNIENREEMSNFKNTKIQINLHFLPKILAYSKFLLYLCTKFVKGVGTNTRKRYEREKLLRDYGGWNR